MGCSGAVKRNEGRQGMRHPGVKTTPGAPGSVPYGQDGALCIDYNFVSKVPGHVGRRVNVSGAMQAQNDEIGFESVRSQQDLFSGYPVLDHKFRRDSHLGMLQIQSVELPLAGHAGLIPHLREIAGG